MRIPSGYFLASCTTLLNCTGLYSPPPAFCFYTTECMPVLVFITCLYFGIHYFWYLRSFYYQCNMFISKVMFSSSVPSFEGLLYLTFLYSLRYQDQCPVGNVCWQMGSWGLLGCVEIDLTLESKMNVRNENWGGEEKRYWTQNTNLIFLSFLSLSVYH